MELPFEEELLDEHERSIDDHITSFRYLLESCDEKETFNQKFENLVKFNDQLKSWHLERLNDSSQTGFNLLMLASKYDNVEAVAFQISNGINVNERDNCGLTASDYAWKNKSSECLVKLLNADAPFPTEFNTENLDSSYVQRDLFNTLKRFVLFYKGESSCEKIINITGKADKFHKSIELGNLAEVTIFVSENPKTRHAYNQHNQCALTSALEFNEIEIYKFLSRNFYEPGIDSEQHKNYREKLTEDIKVSLRDDLLTNLNNLVDDHIKVLLSKSRDRSGEFENFIKLMYFYNDLNNIPEIQPILRLVAKSTNTKILFHFNDEGISFLDATADSNSLGLTYHSGSVLIGAGRSKSEVLATIAHELTHWALQLVYKNRCQPFYKKPKENEKQREFEHIVKKYFKGDEMMGENDLEIANVYDNYSNDQWNTELIVLVPQLLAFHKNHPLKLRALKERYKSLFNFFENNVLPDVEKKIRLLDQEKKIQEVNNDFGVLKKALESDMLSSHCKMKIDFEQNLLVETDLPELALELIVKNLKKRQTAKYVFVELKQMLENENMEKLKQVSVSEVHPKMFIIDSENILQSKMDDEKFFDSTSFFCDLKACFISRTQNNNIREFFENKLEIVHEYEHLNDRAKKKIMNSRIIFQDSDMSFNSIISIESPVMQNLPINVFLGPSTIKLHSFENTLPEKPRLFLNRTYKSIAPILSEDTIETFHIYSDLANTLLKHPTVIIADSAGMGKSTSAVHLARNLKLKDPLSWVVFIDLKQHTKSFVRNHVKCDHSFEKVPSFLSEKVLKIQSKFENILFEDFFKNKKMIFIIDGFDEICPKFEIFIIQILKALKFSENRLLVTTRPHYTKKLEDALDVKAIKLLPFSFENQIDFCIKYWSKEFDLTESDRSVLDLKVVELFTKLRYSSESNGFTGVPIHVFMLAEVYASKNLDDIIPNIFWLYEEFVRIKYKIWTNKGEIAEDDSVTIQRKNMTLHQIFYKLALEQLFKPEDIAGLNLPEISEDVIDDTIARVGIVSYGPECAVQFSHRSFSEYYAADYIFTNTLKKDPLSSVVNLFVKIFFKRDLGQIRNFINDRLQYNDKKLETKSLALHIEKIAFRNRDNNADEFKVSEYDEDFSNSTSKILGYIVREEQTHLITFILKTLNFDRNFKLKLIKEVLHEAVGFPEAFKAIWSCEDISRNKSDTSDLERISMRSEPEDEIYQFLKTGTKSALINRFGLFVKNSVYYTSRFGPFGSSLTFENKPVQFQAMESSIQANAQNKNTRAFKQELLFHKNVENQCILTQAMILDSKTVKNRTEYILSIAILALDEKEFYEFLHDEENGNFPFGNALEYYTFDMIWEAVRFKLSNENIKKLLIGRYIDKKTCLHRKFSNDYVLERYLELLKEFLTVDELNEFLVAKDNEGKRFTYYTVRLSHLRRFKKIWKFVEKNCNNVTKKLLILTDNKILVEESLYNNEITLTNYIFDITEALLQTENEDIITLLRSRGSLTDVILNTAISSLSTLDKFLSKIKPEEFQNILFNNTSKANVLYILIDLDGNQEKKMQVWKQISELFDPEKMQSLLFESGEVVGPVYERFVQCNVFHLAALKSNRILIAMIKYCKLNCSPENFKRIFYEEDEKGWTVLHFLGKYGDSDAIDEYIEFISREERPQLLSKKNKEGRIPIQMAIENKQESVISRLFITYYEVFNEQEFKNIISIENLFSEGFNPRFAKSLIERCMTYLEYKKKKAI